MDIFRDKVIDYLRSLEAYPYVILRNWMTVGTDETNMLDVIVNNKVEFLNASRLVAVSTAMWHCKIRLGRQNLYVNVYDLTDGYFPRDMAEQILKGRQKHADLGLYIIHPSDLFWSTLYHGTYHGTEFSPSDRSLMAALLPNDFNGHVDDKKYSHEWLCKHNILPVKCVDRSVGYNIP